MDNEKSHGNANAQSTDKQTSSTDNKQLIERIPVQHTPFTAIKADGRWFLTLGKYRLSEELEDLDHCVRYAKNIDWFAIMGIIQIMIEQYNETVINPQLTQINDKLHAIHTK